MLWKDKIKEQQKWLEKETRWENAAIIQEHEWEWENISGDLFPKTEYSELTD